MSFIRQYAPACQAMPSSGLVSARHIAMSAKALRIKVDNCAPRPE
jgi:hypothetical protein